VAHPARPASRTWQTLPAASYMMAFNTTHEGSTWRTLCIHARVSLTTLLMSMTWRAISGTPYPQEHGDTLDMVYMDGKFGACGAECKTMQASTR